MTLQGQPGHLTITIDPAQYDSDVDQVAIHVSAAAAGITASLDTWSWCASLDTLEKELTRLHTALKGEMYIKQFDWSHDFDLRIRYDHLGHVTVETHLNCDYGNRCTLEFETDQTYITSFLSDLKRELCMIDRAEKKL